MLLGRTPTELDFAFSGSAEDFLAAHPDARMVGRSVHVCLWRGRECMPLEGGRPETDLCRRDLTINALALGGDGKIHMHPKAAQDLQNSLLRPAAATAFADDPTRIFRLARFAALWPHWRIDAEAFAQMRALSSTALAALPAERVARELRKALAAPAPARFFRVLAQGQALCPWFAELETARAIPAGPARWHANSVFGHSLRLADLLAGDPLAVWMALCHDLGKITTDPTLLPHHYGHEQRGVPLARQLANRLRLPALYAKAGALAAAEHMKAGQFHTLRTGTRRDLLWHVHRTGLAEPFWKLADADSGSNVSAAAQVQLAAMLPVTLPERWRNQGAESARRLRELHCQALAALRDKGG
ncbi:tRNA nucleotidyltransferase (CCA-adding enzyme) [Desulfovibrio legallii]|uniref:tRNA nucleotidyltransferase (CCA-adding enzyme) n=2 Tax=Desulfovibrio legallii TaxID=571438 RepID=A0A1G7LIM9_9BACT|nr:tRNA nucleotidyltransferase (CCA-adding enzyme) [Desulfovibrio legallii]